MSTLTLATKQCSKCGETKPLSKFHRQPANKDGRKGMCARCATDMVKAAKQRRREQMGDEAYRAMLAADQRARRRLNNEAAAYDREYRRAYQQATGALVARHRDEFEHLLLLARRGELPDLKETPDAQ